MAGNHTFLQGSSVSPFENKIRSDKGNFTPNQNLNKENEEDHGHVMELTWVNLTVGVLALLLVFISQLALRRTRNTPNIAKFLSQGLLAFDAFAVVFSLLGELEFLHVPDIVVDLLIEITKTCSLTSYLTIAFLSLDRLVAFRWPNIYLRLSHQPHIKKIMTVVWVLVVFLQLALFLITCLLHFHITLHLHIEKCMVDHNMEYFRFIPIMVIVFITTIPSYVTIYRIIRDQARRSNVETGTVLASYKSSVIIILCLISIVCNTVTYIYIITVPTTHFMLHRIINVLINVNGILDSCAYVLWYKECRNEFIKLILPCCPRQDNRVGVF